jgi:hypothetical protein
MTDYAETLARFWRLASAFADINVTGPVALAVCATMWLRGAQRAALFWAVTFGAGALLVAFSKIGGQFWGWGIPSIGFYGASGHAMLATAVTPVALYALFSNGGPSTKAAALAVGFAVGSAVAISRVELGSHTAPEAIAGAIIGGAVALAFFIPEWKWTPGLHPALLLILIAAPAWRMTDVKMTPEKWIAGSARYFAN